MPGTWTQRRLPGRGDTGICRFGVGKGQALQPGAACISPSPPAVPTGDRPSVGSVQPSQTLSGPHRHSLTCDTFCLPSYCKTSKCRCLPNLWHLASLLPRILPPVSRSFLWMLRDSLSPQPDLSWPLLSPSTHRKRTCHGDHTRHALCPLLPSLLLLTRPLVTPMNWGWGVSRHPVQAAPLFLLSPQPLGVDKPRMPSPAILIPLPVRAPKRVISSADLLP